MAANDVDMSEMKKASGTVIEEPPKFMDLRIADRPTLLEGEVWWQGVKIFFVGDRVLCHAEIDGRVVTHEGVVTAMSVVRLYDSGAGTIEYAV